MTLVKNTNVNGVPIHTHPQWSLASVCATIDAESVSSNYSSYNPEHAIDGDVDTWFGVTDSGFKLRPQHLPIILDFEFPEPLKLHTYSFVVRYEEYYSDPSDWKIYGSTTGAYAGEEVLIDNIVDYNFNDFGYGITDLLSVINDTPFKYYRFVFLKARERYPVTYNYLNMNQFSFNFWVPSTGYDSIDGDGLLDSDKITITRADGTMGHITWADIKTALK